MGFLVMRQCLVWGLYRDDIPLLPGHKPVQFLEGNLRIWQHYRQHVHLQPPWTPAAMSQQSLSVVDM